MTEEQMDGHYLDKDPAEMTRALSEFLEWNIAIGVKLLFPKDARFL